MSTDHEVRAQIKSLYPRLTHIENHLEILMLAVAQLEKQCRILSGPAPAIRKRKGKAGDREENSDD